MHWLKQHQAMPALPSLHGIGYFAGMPAAIATQNVTSPAKSVSFEPAQHAATAIVKQFFDKLFLTS